MTQFRATRAGVMLHWTSWKLARHAGSLTSSVTIGPLTVYWY